MQLVLLLLSKQSFYSSLITESFFKNPFFFLIVERFFVVLLTSELLYCEIHCAMASNKNYRKYLVLCYMHLFPLSLIPAELGVCRRKGVFCAEVSIN